jgi:ribose transport system substrate-binding protein
MAFRFVSVVVVASLLFFACSGGQSTSPKTGSTATVETKVKPGTIGFSLPFATAPFYWAAANGLKDQMESMGYKVIVTNAANDPSQQLQQLTNFGTQKVQAVALIAYDFASVSPAVDKLRADGIAVFAIDRDVSTPTDSFLITDNRKAGAALADFVIKQLNGAKAYIIKDYFAVNVVPLVDRVDGFMEEMAKSYKGKYTVVGEIGGAGGGGDPFEAHIPLFKDVLLKHKETNVFILGTDLLAKPAAAALKELNMFKPAGQAGAPIIVGVDGNPETLDAIRNGDVTACFSQYPYLQGVWAGIMADKWIHGRSDLIPSTLYFGGDVVTYSNIQNYKHLWGDKKWKQID